MNYYPFQSKGYLKPVEGWWMLLTCDPELVRYYCWLAERWGIEMEVGSRHGPHISVIKGQKPKNKKFWFALEGKSYYFKYSNVLRHNGYHAWLDVKCPALSDLRVKLGMDPKPYHSFHLTVGRIKLGIDHALHEPRPKKSKTRKIIV